MVDDKTNLPENVNPEEASQQQVPALPEHVDRYVKGFQSLVDRTIHRMDAVVDYVAPRNTQEELSPENLARGPIVFGLVMMIVVLGIFGLWAIIAPIDSAAIAPGKIVVDTNKKVIDHLEGGIVESIQVTEGMSVKEGQVLITLDNTAALARLNLYKGQYIAAKATEARLIAERDNADEVSFAQDLLDKKGDPLVDENLDSQTRLFKTRREALEGKTDVLTQKIKQYEEEINGLDQQIKSANSQLALLGQEIKDVRYLVGNQNAPKTRLLALERRAAEIKGEKGRNEAMISRAKQSINEGKIEKYNLKTEFLNQVVAELRDTQSKISDISEQLRAAEDVARRVEIKSPIAGEVTNLNVHTVGGVIAPNEPLMQIVPFDDKLIVEAKVRPEDIDVVRPGLSARVRLSAFKTRKVPMIEGIVTTVSADRIEDERTGQAYFNARITIDEDELDELKELDNVQISAGMPAEALIVTGSRTFLQYMVTPISDSFNRSFREQ